MELELADEDEPILYKIAASFYHLKPEQASERVTKSLEALDADIEGLETEASKCRETMDELKAALYAKFGSRQCPRAHVRLYADADHCLCLPLSQ